MTMIKGVKKIVVFQAGEDGSLVKSAEFKKRIRRKRKNSSGMGRPERNVRKMRAAVRTFLDESDQRHNRSARKKKDGWLRDAPKNTMRAQQKAFKKLRKVNII
jgi:hypothetical protein